MTFQQFLDKWADEIIPSKRVRFALDLAKFGAQKHAKGVRDGLTFVSTGENSPTGD